MRGLMRGLAGCRPGGRGERSGLGLLQFHGAAELFVFRAHQLELECEFVDLIAGLFELGRDMRGAFGFDIGEERGGVERFRGGMRGG